MNKKYIVPCTESQVVFSHMIMAGSVINNGNADVIDDQTTEYID